MESIHETYNSDEDIRERGGSFGIFLANQISANSKKNQNNKNTESSDGEYKTYFDRDKGFLEGAKGLDPDDILSGTSVKTILLQRVKGFDYLEDNEGNEIPIKLCTPEQRGKAFQRTYYAIEKNLSR